MNAVRCRCSTGAILGIWLAFLPGAAAAQAEATSTAASSGSPAGQAVKFLSGSAVALAMHEGGHLLLNGIFDADPRIKRVTFGPVPFFAIAHRELSPKREFAVSSAGFWVQNATNEWLLTARPTLRADCAPFAKGILAFNVATSVGYGAVGMAKGGPVERDTRGMAASARIDERAIGLLVMAPAILDLYRYFKPDARWAAWSSRAAKIGGVLLIVR